MRHDFTCCGRHDFPEYPRWWNRPALDSFNEVGNFINWGIAVKYNDTEPVGLAVGIHEYGSKINGKPAVRSVLFEDPDDLRRVALELLALADSPVADQIRARRYQEAVTGG